MTEPCIEVTALCVGGDCPDGMGSLHLEIKSAIESINEPEVQDILKQLAKYGLGIMVPHIHVDEGSGFAPLPRGMIQVESDLQVSFRNSDELNDHGIPVGWRWGKVGAEVVMGCTTLDCKLD